MNDNLRVLGIVPARGGSKRLPKKNLAIFGGKPLVARAIETALASQRLDRIVVSSDDPDILRIARGYDPDIALERPEEISQDRSLAIEFIHHALGYLEGNGEPHFDAVCLIQPSSPLTRPSDIDDTIELLEGGEVDSAVSVSKLDQEFHPMKLKLLQGDLLLPYLQEERGRMAAHEIPTVYSRNGSVYVTRRCAIDQGKVIGDECLGHVMPREFSIDINDEIDLAFAEFMLNRQTHATA